MAWIDRRGGKPGGATAAIGAGEVRPDHHFESLAAVVVGNGRGRRDRPFPRPLAP